MKYSYLAALACVALAAPAAAQTTYFGENQTPGGAVSGNPLTARNNFSAQLTGVSTEDFSGFAVGVTPNPLTFTGSAGLITGTLTGGTISSGPNGVGRFPTSATNYLETSSSSFQITFSEAIAAFGFYGTDIGDFNGQLSIELLRAGGNSVLLVPHTNPSANGSLLFYGVIDTANPFTGVRFLNSSGNDDDFFGFDDLIIGDVRQVTGAIPEPSTWAMLILGFGAVGATLRRRRQVARVSFA